MSRISVARHVTAAFVAAFILGASAQAAEQGPLVLKTDGYFYVGGKLTAVAGKQYMVGLLIGYWPPLFYSDASSLVSYLFDDTPRSYWRDAAISDLAAKGLATEDLSQRKAIYRRLFDRVNQQSYVVPLAVVPDVFVHHRDLAMDVDPVHGQGLMLDDLRWN